MYKKTDMNTYNNIKAIFGDTVQGVIDGELDPLEIYAQFKDFEKYFKDCKDAVQEVAIAEAEKYGEKSFRHKDYSFELREGRANYDFKSIDQWSSLKERIKDIESKSKAAAKNGGSFLDQETGEVIGACQINYSKPSLVIKKL